MTDSERERVRAAIRCEGFDYAFTHYCSFEQGELKVDDPEFHRLRKAFLEAREALADYVGDDEDDEDT